jgi:hypothetical protein
MNIPIYHLSDPYQFIIHASQAEHLGIFKLQEWVLLRVCLPEDLFAAGGIHEVQAGLVYSYRIQRCENPHIRRNP